MDNMAFLHASTIPFDGEVATRACLTKSRVRYCSGEIIFQSSFKIWQQGFLFTKKRGWGFVPGGYARGAQPRIYRHWLRRSLCTFDEMLSSTNLNNLFVLQKWNITQFNIICFIRNFRCFSWFRTLKCRLFPWRENRLCPRLPLICANTILTCFSFDSKDCFCFVWHHLLSSHQHWVIIFDPLTLSCGLEWKGRSHHLQKIEGCLVQHKLVDQFHHI